MSRRPPVRSCRRGAGPDRHLLFAALLLGIAAACLAACSGPGPSSLAAQATALPTVPASPPAPATPAPTPTLSPVAPADARIVEAGPGIPTTFNPLLPDSAGSARILDNLYDSLLTVHAQTAELVPSLAESWELSEDGLTVTFHLRSGLEWHDEAPLTADDVAFTFGAVRETGVADTLKARLNGVQNVLRLDERTVAVGFDRPACAALSDLGIVPILPRHLLQGQALTNEEFNLRHPVGSGPFRFGRILAGGDVSLERNSRYFGGQATFREWIYRPITDTEALLDLWRGGELDLAPIPADRAEAIGEQAVSFAAPEYFAILLNTIDADLKDPRIRQALTFATDREQLLQAALGGRGRLIDGPILPGHWAYAAPNQPSAYRADEARRLLAEAGWSDTDGDGLLDRNGRTLTLGISVNDENPVRKAIALNVQRQWLSVGIAAEADVSEWGSHLERLFTHRFQAAVFSWPVHPDPDSHRLWASDENTLNSGFNFTSYSNPDVDAALQLGLTAPGCSTELRRKSYATVLAALAADQPYIFLFAPNQYLAVSSRLEGVRPGPFGDTGWNVTEWALKLR